jgi:glutamine synthetase
MLVLAPHLNSWRRFASAVYSPASDAWGVENRTVALRVPATSGKARHFEHRLPGVDANPYLVAAVTLAAALDGIADASDPGAPAAGEIHGNGDGAGLPCNWLDAIDHMERSDFARRSLGDLLHQGFIAIKRAEWQRLALEVSEAEWALYGFVI